MSDTDLYRRNFRLHLVEGSLYLASFAFLNFQVVYPALVRRLGGNDIAIGALPVLTYICYFVPQVFAANYTTQTPFRRSWVLGLGIVQRIHILLLAVCIALFGGTNPPLALALFMIVYSLNQFSAGLGAPVWFDFVAKTTLAGKRGKLMGFRSSVGATMGFLNSIILTSVLALLRFPWDFSALFAMAFVYQTASLFVLRKVSGEYPSVVEPPVPLRQLWKRVIAIVKADQTYRRFLLASGFSTIGLVSVGFFTVAALKRFLLPDSYVGFFTMTLLGGQVVLAGLLGFAADRKGHKLSLMVCSGSMAVASVLAIVAPHPALFFIIFAVVGLTFGMEMITRYNFASDCATDATRPMYIGIMNAWLAPFFLFSLLGGFISEMFGYNIVFAAGSLSSLTGFLLLRRLRDPRVAPAIAPPAST